MDLGVLADGLYFLWVLDKVPKELKSINIYSAEAITSMTVITTPSMQNNNINSNEENIK